MKKGMLTTLSALPAEDTENHHHTTIKKGERGKCPCPVPTGSNRPLQSVEKPIGKAMVSSMAPGDTSHPERGAPSTSKV